MDLKQIQQKLQELKLIGGVEIEKLEVPQQFVLFLHSINQCYGLQCTGLLEDDPEEEYELPPGWHELKGGVFSLRYKNYQKNSVIFKLILVSDNININCAYKENLHSLQIKLSALNLQNTEDKEKNQAFLKDYEEKILKNIEKSPPSTTSSNQKNPFLVDEESKSNIHQPYPLQRPPPPQNPQIISPYGNSDLDPFSVGPGNLIGPNNPLFIGGGGFGNNRQPGQVPPGARFDPLNPGGGFRGNEPDNDMFQPQGGFGGMRNMPGFGRGGGGGFGSGGGGFGGGFI